MYRNRAFKDEYKPPKFGTLMLIIANGMVRSGSTLQYNLASKILATSTELHKAGFIGGYEEVENLNKVMGFRNSNSTILFKTHSLPLEVDFYNDNVRVLFCYRDFRDVAASIKKKWGWSFDVILQRLDDLITLEESIMALPNVLSQSYETLFNDMDNAIISLADFLDVSLDPKQIIAIRDESSIKAVKANIGMSLMDKVKHAITRKVDYDAQTLLHKNHISKSNGEKGDWKKQFSDKEITILSTRYQEWLKSHSYL